MSLRQVGSTQNSITLDWKSLNVDSNELVQYVLQMKNNLKKWTVVYSGYKTQKEIMSLKPGEAYRFQLTASNEAGDVLSLTSVEAFATKEEQQAVAHLHRAIKTKNIVKAQKFLKAKGRVVDLFDVWGRSALMIAVWHSDGEAVALLLNNGAEVNLPSSGVEQTALMTACMRGDLDIVKQLMERGALLEIKDKNGCTALNYAVDASQIECLKMALAAGANIESKDKQGWTPLMRAVMVESSLETISELIIRGANVSSGDNRNVTCLMLATLSGNVEVVRMLLTRRCNPNVKDIYGNTAITMATSKQNEEIITLLNKRNKFLGMNRTLTRGISMAALLRDVNTSKPPSNPTGS